MDRATWFYSEVLGLEQVERPPFDFGGAWYQLGAHTLHLIVHPPTRTLRHSMEIGPREGHMALRVRDRQEVIDRLTQYGRSEEHTSELQSPCNLVCRLLLEKKKK